MTAIAEEGIGVTSCIDKSAVRSWCHEVRAVVTAGDEHESYIRCVVPVSSLSISSDFLDPN